MVHGSLRDRLVLTCDNQVLSPQIELLFVQDDIDVRKDELDLWDRYLSDPLGEGPPIQCNDLKNLRHGVPRQTGFAR